jgi:hypothetical protein
MLTRKKIAKNAAQLIFVELFPLKQKPGHFGLHTSVLLKTLPKENNHDFRIYKY